MNSITFPSTYLVNTIHPYFHKKYEIKTKQKKPKQKQKLI